MIDADLITECRRLALSTAPELSSRPLYVVDAEVFDGLTIKRDCLAWAMQNTLDFELTDRIPGWDQPGPVVALFGGAIFEAYGPEHFRAGTLATMLHETGHLLPIPSVTWQDRPPEFDTAEIRSLLSRKTAEATAAPEPEDLSPDAHHGQRFIRTVTHLYARSRLAGYDLPHQDLFGGTLFLPQLPHFLAALLPEIVSMLDAPFDEILDQAPPAEFSELWTASVDNHNFHSRKGS